MVGSTQQALLSEDCDPERHPIEGVIQMDPAMNRVENRLQSFKCWLIEDEPGCVCTAKKMAESGFFHCGGEQEPDLTRCFVCQKEMEGWEAEDNPMEARYHTKKCAFAKLGRPASELTNADMLKLINCQQTERLRALTEERVADFKEKAEEVRLQLAALTKRPRKRRQ